MRSVYALVVISAIALPAFALAVPTAAAAATVTETDRISGPDRYATAVAISSEYPAGVGVVYVASGANFPDALSAAPAASLQGGPLLLAPQAALPDLVRNEIVRLRPALIVVVGGPMSVSSRVYDQLAMIAPIRRDAGLDRYETSRIIVRNAFRAGADTAIVATGANFPDALSGAGGASLTSCSPVTTAPPAAPAGAGSSPLHTNIVATTFWVGEIFDAGLSDGSQVCSTYDGQWAFRHTGVNLGTTPASASGCAGSVYGGRDGRSSGTGTGFTCTTERRTASNGYFPTAQPRPLQNPFYLDLPYDDLNDSIGFAERCTVIPWAASVGLQHCADEDFSYRKNRWVQITGPNRNVCYGQIEDAGPSSGSKHHDANYVFGGADARPVNLKFSGDPSQGAGMDVSPALNGCLGFASLNGDNDRIAWRFIDRADVPAGPWLTVETTSQVSW
jgi:hypothetical protein